MTDSTLPNALTQLLVEHRAAHDPHYPPSDNSDHGPMTYLAMHGLGIDVPAIERFSDQYRRKLASYPPPNYTVGKHDWTLHLGRRESYSALLRFFDAEVSTEGWQGTVARYLPMLISGWVKNAFHPIIRLGYGIEFEAPSEIAAGLAYLTITGDDPRMAAIANRPLTDSSGRSYLASLRAARDPAYSRGPFNARYNRIIETANVLPAMEGTHGVLNEISRACLEVFHTTHDFFALHLVTASHAFRICAPWAGRNPNLLYSVGIGAAYLAIGAPAFDPVARATADLPIDALSTATDEHDIKLAYSCLAQSRTFADPTYEWAATGYLEPRLRPERR